VLRRDFKFPPATLFIEVPSLVWDSTEPR